MLQNVCSACQHGAAQRWLFAAALSEKGGLSPAVSFLDAFLGTINVQIGGLPRNNAQHLMKSGILCVWTCKGRIEDGWSIDFAAIFQFDLTWAEFVAGHWAQFQEEYSLPAARSANGSASPLTAVSTERLSSSGC